MRVNSRDKLPYVDAVLHEVMRIRPVVPQGVPHAMTKATKLGELWKICIV